MAQNGEFVVRYTNKDIVEKIDQNNEHMLKRHEHLIEKFEHVERKLDVAVAKTRTNRKLVFGAYIYISTLVTAFIMFLIR